MKKGILKAIGFMLLIGFVYLAANIIVAVGFIILIVIKNRELLSGDFTTMIDMMLIGMNDYLLPMVIGANVLSLIIIWLIFLGRKDKFSDYCKFRKIRILDGLIIIMFGSFMNFLFITILSLIGSIGVFSNQLDDYAELMEPLLDSPFYLMFIAIAISAPIFEEIIMRGIILNDFKKVTPVWLAIIIQALAFGLMHFNIVQSSYAAVLGIVLGLIYVKYKSIWMPILFHFGFNFTSLISDLVLTDDTSLWLVGAIGLIGSLVFLYIAKVSYHGEFYKEVINEIIELDENDEVLDVREG